MALCLNDTSFRVRSKISNNLNCITEFGEKSGSQMCSLMQFNYFRCSGKY